MILGFRANINQDSHRIFINRLVDYGVLFKGMPSKENSEEYTFLFDSEGDFIKAQKVKRSMSEKYEDVPLHKSL